jgi:hypothetical protein
MCLVIASAWSRPRCLSRTALCLYIVIFGESHWLLDDLGRRTAIRRHMENFIERGCILACPDRDHHAYQINIDIVLLPFPHQRTGVLLQQPRTKSYARIALATSQRDSLSELNPFSRLTGGSKFQDTPSQLLSLSVRPKVFTKSQCSVDVLSWSWSTRTPVFSAFLNGTDMETPTDAHGEWSAVG